MGECLPHVEFAYNRVAYSTTRHSQFEIVYGFNPLLLLIFFSLSSTYILKHKDGKVKAEYVKKLQEQVKAQIEQKTKSYVRN